jgi:hypothetical protein
MAIVTFRYIHVGRATDGTKLVTLRWPPAKKFPGIPIEELDALYEVVMELANHKDDIRGLVVASIEQTGKTRGWKLMHRTGQRRWKEGAAEKLRQALGDAAFRLVPKSPAEVLAEFGPNAGPLVDELSTGGETIAYVTRGDTTHVRVMK